MKKKTKKRNPQDLTSRNNNARKREIAGLEVRMARIEMVLSCVHKALEVWLGMIKK